jgi:hypothetical protein
MLPLRALGEGLGISVKWISETRVVDMGVNAEYQKHLMPKKDWEAKVKGDS